MTDLETVLGPAGGPPTPRVWFFLAEDHPTLKKELLGGSATGSAVTPRFSSVGNAMGTVGGT